MEVGVRRNGWWDMYWGNGGSAQLQLTAAKQGEIENVV